MTTQETIDDANNKLASAQAFYDSAIATEALARATMIDWYNLAVQCNASVGQVPGVFVSRDSCSTRTSGPCQSVNTCKGNIDSYNSTITTYNAKVAETTNKKALLDAAVDYKNQVVANAQNDPTFIAQQQQNTNAAILAQKKLDTERAATRNKIIGIVVVVIVIVVAIYIWKKIK